MGAVFSYVIGLGAAVMMPVIFTVLGVCVGIRFSKALKSGLLVGVGFVGLGVVTALLTSNLGPALKGMTDLYHLNLPFFDLGWPAAAAVAYSTAVGAFIIPVCLIAARYELYNPEFFSKVNPLWHAPMVIGMLIAYVLFRHLLFLLFKPGRMHAEVEDTMHHVLYTFFCILATIMLATIVVVRIAGIPEATVRTVLIWETAVVFFLSLIRTGQIFAQHINGFSTILYLCILELIPAAAVVASAIIF